VILGPSYILIPYEAAQQLIFAAYAMVAHAGRKDGVQASDECECLTCDIPPGNQQLNLHERRSLDLNSVHE
jgi:hypothetical protein